MPEKKGYILIKFIKKDKKGTAVIKVKKNKNYYVAKIKIHNKSSSLSNILTKHTLKTEIQALKFFKNIIYLFMKNILTVGHVKIFILL